MRRSRSASAITALISLMPLSTALKGMNSQRVIARDQLGQRGLADARRSPENDRGQLVALDLAAQRLAGAEDVLLADEIFQALGPHALGQRTLAVVGADRGIGLGRVESNRLTRAALLCRRAS